jgi:hypothetical protein
MTPKEFITKELGCFIKKFPQVRVRYEFHEMSNAHFVEIVPNEVYNLNEDYISWEIDMWERFVKLFPEEGICFISDDALVGIENVELTLYGTDYAPVSTVRESITFDPITILLHQSVTKRTFDVTVTESKGESHTIETTQVPCEYSSQTYLLAA